MLVVKSLLRDIRSKHFFSSGLHFTWQVKRFRFAGGALACKKKERKSKKERAEKIGTFRGFITH